MYMGAFPALRTGNRAFRGSGPGALRRGCRQPTVAAPLQSLALSVSGIILRQVEPVPNRFEPGLRTQLLQKIPPQSQKHQKSKEKRGLSPKTSPAYSTLRLKSLQFCLFFKDLKVNTVAPAQYPAP
jgi:hypothetical protein